MTIPSHMITLTSEEKILLHLSILQQNTIEGFSAPMEIAQEGIAKALGINRTHIPRTTKKLVSKGLIEEMKRHVPGAKRKRKVYYLTFKGQNAVETIKANILRQKVIVKSMGVMRVTNLGEFHEQLPTTITLIDLVDSIKPVGFIEDDVIMASSDVRKKHVIFPENIDMTKKFHGRKRELALIRLRLADDATRLFIITGIAGIGKTSLALNVIKEIKDHSSVFYHRFNEFDTLRKIGKKFSRFLFKARRPELRNYLDSTVAYDIGTALGITIKDLSAMRTLVILDDYQKCSPRICAFVREALLKKDKLGNVKFMILSREVPGCFELGKDTARGSLLELKLEGLTRVGTRLMLGLEEKDSQMLNNIYNATEGHPLFIELIRSVKGNNQMVRGKSNISRYLQDEVISSLEADEKKMLQVACVYRGSFPAEAIFIDEDISWDCIDSLRNKYLLISREKKFGMHDLVREHLLSRLNPESKKRYHLWAAKQYDKYQTPQDWLESAHHLLQGGEYREGFELVREKGPDIIQEEHFEEFSNILETLETFLPGKDVLAEVMHFRGTIYIYWLMFAQAIECFEEAIKLWDELGDLGKKEEAAYLLKKARNHSLF